MQIRKEELKSRIRERIEDEIEDLQEDLELAQEEDGKTTQGLGGGRKL